MDKPISVNVIRDLFLWLEGFLFTLAFVSHLALRIIIFHTQHFILPVRVSGPVGALDDRFDIAVKIRATVQAAIGVIMMVVGGLYLKASVMSLAHGN